MIVLIAETSGVADIRTRCSHLNNDLAKNFGKSIGEILSPVLVFSGKYWDGYFLQNL